MNNTQIWLKNNDKLKNLDEIRKYKYVCIKNNSDTPAIKINGRYRCKFSDWNNGKMYLANVYKNYEKAKSQYVCIHPKLLELSSDYLVDCPIENQSSLTFEIKDQEPENEINIISNEKKEKKILKVNQPIIKVIKAETILDKLKRNKKLFYILIASTVIGIFAFILSLF